MLIPQAGDTCAVRVPIPHEFDAADAEQIAFDQLDKLCRLHGFVPSDFKLASREPWIDGDGVHLGFDLLIFEALTAYPVDVNA